MMMCVLVEAYTIIFPFSDPRVGIYSLCQSGQGRPGRCLYIGDSVSYPVLQTSESPHGRCAGWL